MNKKKAAFLVTCVVLLICINKTFAGETEIKAIEKLLTNRNNVIELTGVVRNPEYEYQYGKSVNGGTFIRMKGMIPFDTTREDSKTIVLLSLKNVMEMRKDCEWFRLIFYPEKMRGRTREIVNASYITGKLNITYRIPSDKQIKKNNDKIGKTEEWMPGRTYINNNPKLFRPNIVYYDKASGFYLMFDDLFKKYPTAKEKQVIKLVADKKKTTEKEAKQYINFIYYYYGVFLNDTENIDLKK